MPALLTDLCNGPSNERSATDRVVPVALLDHLVGWFHVLALLPDIRELSIQGDLKRMRPTFNIIEGRRQLVTGFSLLRESGVVPHERLSSLHLGTASWRLTGSSGDLLYR